jgi:hypothetical protein
METNENISIKLNQLGEIPSQISNSLYKYLSKIEDIFTDYETKKQNAMNYIKNTGPTMTEIANIVGCSRTTFYNHNQLIKRYIELSINSLMANNPYTRINKLEDLYQTSKNRYEMLISRDIEYELLRQENEKLISVVKDQKDQIIKLNIQIANLKTARLRV